jgi:NAD-specific glutamate dehydrogenase
LIRPAFAAQFTICGIKLFSAAEERKKFLAPIAEKMGMTAELKKLKTLEECETFTSLLRKKQIADLIAQNKKLRRQADYSTSQEQIDQVYTWMDENDEKVKTLENDIEDIQKRLDEDN